MIRVLRAKPQLYPKFVPRDKYEILIEGEREEYLGKPPDQRTRKVKTITRTKIYHAQCRICNNEHKEEINKMLNDGKSLDDVVTTFQAYPINRKFLSEHIAAKHLENPDIDKGWIFWYHSDQVIGGKVFVHWSEEAQKFY